MVATDGTNRKAGIMRIYKKVHLGVATTGRIIALRKKQITTGSKCMMLGLEEVDKLLDHEVKGVLKRVTSCPPPSRQILLYSVTFPLTVQTFRRKHMKDPYKINLMEELTLKGSTQEYVIVQERQKWGELMAKKATEAATKGRLLLVP